MIKSDDGKKAERQPRKVFRNVFFERHMPGGEVISYPGYMKVTKDKSGKKVSFCGIVEGFEAMVWSVAETEEELCRNIGIMLELFLGKEVHSSPGEGSEIAAARFVHN